MPVHYTVVSKKSVLSGDPQVKYYPQLTNRSTVDMRTMCDLISEKCAVSPADIYGVVEALLGEITHQLKEGRNVKLDSLGTFSLHASAHGHDQPEKVTSRDIKNLKVSFLASPYMKRLIKLTSFKKATKR